MWEKIEQLIEEQGITVYRLGQLTGLGVSIFYNLKSGRIKDITLRNAFKIADALGVKVDDFRERGK
jgi:Helix-turn-helix.